MPPSQRSDARQNQAFARAELREAGDLEPGLGRDEVALGALHRLLAVIGRAFEPGVRANDATVAGAARVETTLRSERLRAALEVALAPAPVVALDEERFRDVLELCAWTDALIDDRSGRRKRFERAVPVVAVAVGAVVLLVATLGNRNLAYGMPVKASSICSYSPPVPFNEPQLGRVVDGIHYEVPRYVEWGQTTFAACTNIEAHPWIKVDLGKRRTLSRAAVYGRAECCWSDTLPLSLQVSDDNHHFETVATTHTPFTAEFPWKVSLDGRQARYVRLFIQSNKAKSIVVSELEVYGH